VAAINFFTGLSCEGYSMATRVEPFLRYFDGVIEQGGQLPIRPTLSCVDQAPNGSLTAFFGYSNPNVVGVDIPRGPDNRLPEDTAAAGPTQFRPGDHPWDFFLSFSRRDKLEYQLRSGGDGCREREKSVVASSRSPRCDANAPDVSCARLCQG